MGEMAAAWRNPGLRLVFALFVGLLGIAAMLAVASGQPRHGLSLTIDGTRIMAHDLRGLTGAVRVIGVADGDRTIPLSVEDIIPEPDVLPDYATLDRFFVRQGTLARAMEKETILVVASGARERRIRLTERPGIAPGTWRQMLIGLIGFSISAWVWSIAPWRLPNILFGLSGVAMLAFTGSAAIYTSREIAIDGTLFWWLSATNLVGASLFGVAMACLFLVYPRRVAPPALLIALGVLFAAWALAALLRLLPSPAVGGHLAVTLQMLLIATGIVIQVFATRGDPVGRAALRWIGTATLFGAGGFIATTSGPAAIGLPPLVDQGWAFAFFLIIHAGVAIGLRRERLFAIDSWGFGLLFYGGITMVFLATDIALVVLLGSISAAAAVTGVILLPLLYLPLRDVLTRRIGGRTDVAETLERVALVALAPGVEDRNRLWRGALDRAFAPLETIPAPPVERVAIADEGRVMIVPGIGEGSAYRLTLARRGRALFKPTDQRLAARMVDLASQVDGDRRAYERGVDTERMRVARDLHDDLAARLMNGLALDDPDRLRETLRAALAEVRSIVNATLSGPAPLVDVLADSRSEAADRLEASGIALDWVPEPLGGTLSAESAKALTSALRELVTNVVRHSSATTMSVFARIDAGWLHLRVEDDGAPAADGPIVPGNGLKNIVQRLKMIGGRADYEIAPRGFRMTVALPVSGPVPGPVSLT